VKKVHTVERKIIGERLGTFAPVREEVGEECDQNRKHREKAGLFRRRVEKGARVIRRNKEETARRLGSSDCIPVGFLGRQRDTPARRRQRTSWPREKAGLFGLGLPWLSFAHPTAGALAPSDATATWAGHGRPAAGRG